MEISAALVGSCTNSSYEDISRAASIAREAAAKGLTASIVDDHPGSEPPCAPIERDGLLATRSHRRRGACQCVRPVHRAVEARRVGTSASNLIVTCFTATSPSATTACPTFAFVTSPETVFAFALSGRVDFDPPIDTPDPRAARSVWSLARFFPRRF